MQEILNYVQIRPRIATSGQPTKDQFKAIASSEYRLVVNLAMPDSDGAIASEGSIVTSLGLDYVHLPVPFNAPSVEHLRKFIQIMTAYKQDKVWVHCAVNARVSAFMYHYLSKYQGLSESDSRSVILEHWQESMDEVWRSFLNLTKKEIDLG